jgi:glycosyltransferase involved in cell wall biosynthesis
MQISQNDDVIELGFVSEEEKFAAIAGAKALVLPSRLESLGIVVLEAMRLGVPVLLSAHSEVLRQQAKRSNGGLYFYGQEDFEKVLYLLLTDRKLAKALGENGIRYVESHYRWDIIEKKLCGIIDKVCGHELED